MKTNSTSFNRIVGLLLAIVMAVGLTACGSHDAGRPDNTGIEVGDVVAPPAPESKSGYQSRLPKPKKKNPEDALKLYGEIVTVTKSVKTPSKPKTENASNATQYGTVDWSTAANGYITFTAKGQERALILQGPNTGVQACFTVAKDDSIKVALMDGTGKYQYAIANNTNGGKSYRVQYKNSFTVDKIDADLVPFLVSTPWGDYENAPNATKKAAELWDTEKTQLDNVKAISKWLRELDYDKKLKQGTVDKYVNPDSVIEKGGGVCNEMSKLLVAMLRSQGVPAYYQSGLKNDENHAWVRAWIELSTSTENSITYSKGAWVNIEATGGEILLKSNYDRSYSTESNHYAN